MPPRYWVYIGTAVQGPVEVPALRKLEGFNLLTQVCAEGEQSWRMADEVIEIKSYFLSPPRPMALPFESGNTAPYIESLPEIETLPEPKKESPVVLSIVEPAGEPPKGAVSPAGLRVACVHCGYKNPRDVAGCMKCGGSLKAAKEELELAPPKTDLGTLIQSASAAAPDASVETVVPTRPAVEIPMARIAIITAILSAVTASGIIGHHVWIKKHHKPRTLLNGGGSVVVATPRPAAASRNVRRGALKAARRSTGSSVRHSVSAPTRERAAQAATLPGVDTGETRPAGYRVLPQATPLKHRESSAMDSRYASERRSDSRLWTQKEEQAIRLVQKQRIYGGLRTLQRNADILMQILRDREYMTGFETGKRPFLYNQAEWGASPLEGPVYQVRLTFLGGKDANNFPLKPLKFAFDADLERGTVKPGGDDAIRANAMHAFFDEGRIPPEERRDIAKDVEQVVLAAQPGESPLALDTVLRRFVATYSVDAAQRVADAFKLDTVQKRIRHDPRLAGEVKPPAETSEAIKATSVPGMASSSWQAAPPAAKAKSQMPKPTAQPFTGNGSAVEFRMERAEGRGRTLQVRFTSRATPARLWESLTGYDRLKQFVPDMLLSEREGQDGRAVIVHTQSLVRLFFFVFKVDLHLRILEHPEQYQLEFEKIAGEFESFRGAVQIVADPVTKQSVLNFNATLVPKGRSMDWALRDASRQFLVSLFNSIRIQAEAN